MHGSWQNFSCISRYTENLPLAAANAYLDIEKGGYQFI